MLTNLFNTIPYIYSYKSVKDNVLTLKYFVPYINTKEDLSVEIYDNVLIVQSKYDNESFILDKVRISNYKLLNAKYDNDVLTINLERKESSSIVIE